MLILLLDLRSGMPSRPPRVEIISPGLKWLELPSTHRPVSWRRGSRMPKLYLQLTTFSLSICLSQARHDLSAHYTTLTNSTLQSTRERLFEHADKNGKLFCKFVGGS